MTVAVSPLTPAQADNVGIMNDVFAEDTRQVIRSTPFDPSAPKPGFMDAVGAALWRENTLASAWHYITDGANRSLGEVQSYNPYQQLKASYDADTLDRLKPYISSGEFDHVRSDTQLAATVKDLLDEQRTNALMDKQGLGYFAGSLLAAVLDPVSYIPFVDDAKFASLGKAGLFALNGALSTGVSEAALQATQRHRSLEESLMNIGSSALIGGGLGIFAAALHPHSAMNPANPHNVFKTENLRADGEISRDMTGKQDELSAEELANLQRSYVSAGAAAVRGENGFTLARGTASTPVGKIVRKAGDAFNSATIKGQVLRANSPAARWLGVRLFDPAGILSEGNLKGIPNAVSATILKHDFMSEHERLAAMMEAGTRQVAQDAKTRVDHKDVMLLTQRHLYGEVDPATQGSLTNKYGPAYTAVDDAAQKNAARIHDFNGMWEQRLREHGLVQDPAIVSKLTGEVKTLRDQINNFPTPEKGSPEETQLKALRTQRDEAIAALGEEMQKAPPLGKDYGHAQLWNRDAIFQAPSEFKGWLHDVFAFRPEAQWLAENHGMTLDEFDKLSPQDARPIREEWAGDEKAFEIEQLTHHLDGLKQSLKGNRLDLEEAFRWFGVLDKRETNLSLSEARKKRDAVWAKVGSSKDPALKARAEQLDTLWRKIEATHEDIKTSKGELDAGIRDAKAARLKLETEARKTGRALTKAKQRSPLSEMVEQVYDAMSSTGHVPANFVNQIVSRSDREVGRVKARALNLSKQQRVDAIKRGWLRDDLSNILLSSTDQLASEIALRDAVGVGPNKAFSSWDDTLSWVESDYQQQIEEASNQATKNHLLAEMKTTVKNLIEARDRLKGGSHIDDGTSNGWMRWGMNQMKRANMIRYGSGFVLSSLTDTATMALRHGSLSPLLVRYGTRAIKEMRAAITDDTSAFQSYIRAVEVGSGAHASAKRFGTDDALHEQLVGYGIGVGTTRRVTGQIDRVGERMSEIGIKLSGLPLWNTFWKTVAGLHMIDRLHDLTGRYGALKPSEIADLATLGIGHGEASRISDMMAKFGETDAEGHFDPGFEKWTDRDAERTARLAIQRDMNRAINTPDVGDTPRLMSTHIGNMLLSFQTFAFAFMNQYAYPLAQRLSLFHEKNAYMSLGILLGSAMAVIVGKDLLNGRDPSQRFTKEAWESTLYELVDRSGMIGYTSPYADSALKLSSPITGFAGGARYARNGWLESLLGINYSLVQDVQKTGAAWFDPTTSIGDKVRKTMVVAPFAAQAKLLGRIIPQN